jgi:hypothetical protein
MQPIQIHAKIIENLLLLGSNVVILACLDHGQNHRLMYAFCPFSWWCFKNVRCQITENPLLFPLMGIYRENRRMSDKNSGLTIKPT